MIQNNNQGEYNIINHRYGYDDDDNNNSYGYYGNTQQYNQQQNYEGYYQH